MFRSNTLVQLVDESPAMPGGSGVHSWLVDFFPVPDATNGETLCGIIALNVASLRTEQRDELRQRIGHPTKAPSERKDRRQS